MINYVLKMMDHVLKMMDSAFESGLPRDINQTKVPGCAFCLPFFYGPILLADGSMVATVPPSGNTHVTKLINLPPFWVYFAIH